MKVGPQGWLEMTDGDPEVRVFQTVRTCRLRSPTPLGIVWHWTAGRGGPGFSEMLARQAQTYKRGVDRPASWHVLIARDGTIYQSAPFTVGTWHVGRPGIIAGQHFDNVNRATVGCELENAGRLEYVDGHFYCWPYWTNPGAPAGERKPDSRYAINASRAVAIPGQGTFDAFTSEQERSAAAMLHALVSRYGWKREVCVYGHRDFDSPRKEDPGPVWADAILPRILNAG